MAAVLTSNGIVFPDTKKTKDYNKKTSKCEDTGKVREEDRKIIAQHCCASVKRFIAESSHAEDSIKN